MDLRREPSKLARKEHMSEELPLYSTMPVLQDTEPGGVDNFKRDFTDSARRRERGVFGRSPAAQLEETVGSEPLDTDTALEILSDAFESRNRAEAAEWRAEEAEEDRLDVLAYSGGYETREEYASVLDELLNHDGYTSPRFQSLIADWNERDPQGADAYLESREYALTLAAAAEGRAVAQNLQASYEAEFAKVLNDFQSENPGARAGIGHDLIAVALANDPNAFASPQAFRTALDRVAEHVDDATEALATTAEEGAMRAAMRAEIQRLSPMRPVTAEHRASADARAWQAMPKSAEELQAEILRRTKSYKQAAKAGGGEQFRSAFAQAARGSGFGEGAREQAARALEAREEEKAGRRPPNRGI
jgi:hypothetical protein